MLDVSNETALQYAVAWVGPLAASPRFRRTVCLQAEQLARAPSSYQAAQGVVVPAGLTLNVVLAMPVVLTADWTLILPTSSRCSVRRLDSCSSRPRGRHSPPPRKLWLAQASLALCLPVASASAVASAAGRSDSGVKNKEAFWLNWLNTQTKLAARGSRQQAA